MVTNRFVTMLKPRRLDMDSVTRVRIKVLTEYKKFFNAKGLVAESHLCGYIPRIYVRVHKMLNGSLRRANSAVIGLSLVGMLTGASAFSVMPALRPASLRSSSHAGRPTSL